MTSSPFLLAAAALAAASLPAAAEAGLTDADVGNWTVGDCIMAQFAMELVAHLPNSTNVTVPPLHLLVPVGAKADQNQANCKLDQDRQSLSLSWTDRAVNGTYEPLGRNLTIIFAKLNDTA